MTLNFARLPDGFPQLEQLVADIEGFIAPPSADEAQSAGERVYRELRNCTPNELSSVRSSIKRRVPYAMWLDNQRDIHQNRAVIDWYYEQIQSLKLDSGSRIRRMLAPLFHTYILKFSPNTEDFQKLAINMWTVAKRCAAADIPVLKLSSLQNKYEFFSVQQVGMQLSSAFISSTQHQKTIDRWFESLGLWSGFKSTALGYHTYECALKLPSNIYRKEDSINAIIEWSASLSDGLSADQKAMLADALLNPWVEQDPSNSLKMKILDFCIKIMGDPRSDTFSWSKATPSSKNVLMRWLIGRTLETFFDVLRQTADSIWKHRQEFWTNYHRNGYISDAWVVLGPDAHKYVASRYAGENLGYGRLTGTSDDAQSVLLMKIGDLLFCEWSHNGKLRVTSYDSYASPRLHKQTYGAEELRFESMVFTSNTGVEHAGLPHLHSDSRWWQTTAAAFISRKLGIRR
jgi:hypothetical protein